MAIGAGSAGPLSTVVCQALAGMDPMDWKAFNEKLEAQKTLETELAYAMTEWEEAQTALEEAQR